MKIIATVSEQDILSLDRYDTSCVDVLEIRLDLCSEKFLSENFSSSLSDWKGALLFTYRNQEDSSIKDQHIQRKDFIEKFLEPFNSENNFLDIDMKRDHGMFEKYEISNFAFHLFYS
ncbi:MAG TPA: type I 3-dehydroquinate dehydratase [Leptospiraceae bacterium]|nr:type I 3-dehydroquinate dehydratase [Leptospiraceae bacterium]